MVEQFFVQESQVSLTKTRFERNSAVAGGAIFVQESQVNLTKTRFEQNSAVDGIGGAIVAVSAIIHAKNCTMIGNIAYLGGSLSTSNSTLLVEECEFDSNKASEFGGAVICSSSNISIKTTNFYNSISMVSGGVFNSLRLQT